MRLALLVLALVALLAVAPAAHAAPNVQFGLQDDAWVAHGPGTLEERVAALERLGVDIVRFNLRWNRIATEKPRAPRDPADPAYDWGAADRVLPALRERGIDVVVTLTGTPGWANRGRAANWAPGSKWAFRNFAFAAATRYPWIRHWLVWNEPNQRRHLRPTSARTYVNKLLNPAYGAIHAVIPNAKVGGGATAPRGAAGGVSPVRWIRAMKAAGARLDAYAHHPYPLRPRQETPSSGGCARCETITMATLERLLSEVRRAFGPKRIWLTEYGYQTNPPDRILGVPHPVQARYVGESALRVRRAARVDMLIWFLYQDETVWQSGLQRANGASKLSMRAFQLPLAQVSRRGARTVLWGQVRPRDGRQPYRLQQKRGGAWRWVGRVKTTDARGSFQRTVRAFPGAKFRVYSPRDDSYGPALTIR